MASNGALARNLAAELRQLAKAGSSDMLAAVARETGDAAVDDMSEAVHGDLGDTSMSGWRRKAPIPVEAQAKVDGTSAVIIPTKAATGPFKVLDRGRNLGQTGAFQGPGANRKTGTTRRTKKGDIAKIRSFGTRHWNGYTAGKNTWSDGERLIEERTPRRAIDLLSKMIVEELRG